MRRFLSPLRVAGALAILVVITGIILWVAPSGDYIFLPDTAKPVAPLVSVEGQRKRARDRGSVYYLAVLVRKATLLEQLFPGIHEGATIVPRSALFPKGVSEQRQRRIEQREMSQSQNVAAVVALRELGYDIPLGKGVRVVSVLKGMPARGKLDPGDVITSADGDPVTSTCTLRSLFSRTSPGQQVTLDVRRRGRERSVRLRLASDHGRPVIGVIVADPRLPKRLPVRVKIDIGSVVGPSAGLAFALEIMEKLGRNADHGLKIAATGELAPDGCLVPIGGVEQKAIEARRAHADVMLLPVGDDAAVARKYAAPVRVIPVASVRDALRKLATVPRTG